MAKYYCQHWKKHFKSFTDIPRKSIPFKKPTLAKFAKGRSKPIVCAPLSIGTVSHREYQTTVVKFIVGLQEMAEISCVC